MPRFFIPARLQTGGAPEVQEMVYDSAATFARGALMSVASDGEVTEASADPTSIIGVALHKNGVGPGRNLENDDDYVVRTNVSNLVGIAIANRSAIFSGQAVNGGTDPVTPLLTHIGEEYGVVKRSDGTWAIDMAETTTKVVHIVDIDTTRENKIFLFKFLEAVLARP